MKYKISPFIKLILTGVMLCSMAPVWSAAGEPPFLAGQVAVYASPAELPGQQVIKFLPNAGISVVKVAQGKEWGQVQKFRAMGKRAGVNHIAKAFVNDPGYSLQWHFPKVQAEQAWAVSTGIGVTVAVLDTGLVAGGSDGIACVTAGRDIVNGDDTPVDGDGHGTHVSGTIAQTTDNSVGVAGLAHGACIMPVKVLDDSGSGAFADIADGIYWAVANGAKVINMSLGIPARYNMTYDGVLGPALDHAYNQGTTVVCASGNDGSRKNVSYPASHQYTIAVGATDASDRVPRYSNKGAGLDLVAPGGDMTKDDNQDGYGDGVLQETNNNGVWGYWFFQGTSMASPHVAAAAAMLIANGTATHPSDVKDALTSSALDLGDSGYDKISGHGLLQSYAALTGDNGGGGDDSSCTDADGDGFCEPVDCNDNNANVYPGHNDLKGRWGRDGLDNDCNGVIDG